MATIPSYRSLSQCRREPGPLCIAGFGHIQVSPINPAPPSLDFQEALRYRNGMRVEPCPETRLPAQLLDVAGNRGEALRKCRVADRIETVGDHLIAIDTSCEKAAHQRGQQYPRPLVLNQELNRPADILQRVFLIIGVAACIPGANAAGLGPARQRKLHLWHIPPSPGPARRRTPLPRSVRRPSACPAREASKSRWMRHRDNSVFSQTIGTWY